MKPLFRRFTGPVIVVYLLNWGIWALALQVEQIMLSALTRSFNWVADMIGVSHIEIAYWSARWVAEESLSEGFFPISLGLLIGWWVFRKKQRRVSM